LTYTITVNNVTTGAALRILKVDQSDRPLEGAQFTLTGDRIEDRNDLVSAIPVGGTDAVIYINGDMPAGTYILTETATIEGYILPEHPIIITITDEAGTGAGGMRVTATVNGVEIPYPKLAQNPATGEWTLKVTNQTGYELPSTGGTGTGFIYILGATLAMIGGAGLLRKRVPLWREE
jgi:LPXTG-motif cell wall-anchored protein